MYLGLFLFTVVLGGATHAFAYESGLKTAQKLSPIHQLYSISFTWGFEDRDLLIPVLAKRGLAYDEASTTVGYELESEGGLRVKTGTTTAFVIANLPIENGFYRLAAGETATFRLLALHEAASSTQKLKLKASALPFNLETKGKVSKTYLHPHELTKYVTDAI